MDRECICASIGIMVEVVDLSYGLRGVIYFGQVTIEGVLMQCVVLLQNEGEGEGEWGGE